jgi:hypothetical protein
MPSLSEIRARLTAEENKTQNRTSSDNAIYPFWNMSEGSVATIRFTEDGDTSNDFFWVERLIIKLPFNGIKGKSDNKEVIVQVPCMEMYGENCPILTEIRPWYKDASLEKLANKYWKKRSYLYQGFVRANPLGDDTTPDNPIRRFIINSQLHGIIKASLVDPDLEELPTDAVRGLDFNIRKTNNGTYSTYTTSNWARKETPLTEAELAAIDAHGLYNLKDFLPKKPTEAELKIIKEMFEASVDGRPYDPDKFGAYYRPYGLDIPASNAPVNDSVSSSSESSTPVERTVTTTEDTDLPWEDDTSAKDEVVVPQAKSSGDKAEEILAMIRSRQNKG